MKKVTSLFLVVVLFSTMFCFSASAEKFKVTTQTDPLRVRDKAYGGDVVGLLPKGTVVEGTRVDPWKVKITYNGQTAYIYSGYLTPVGSSTPTTTKPTTTKPTTTKPTTSNPTTTNHSTSYSQPHVSASAKDYGSLCYRLDNADRLLPKDGELYQVSIKRDTVRVWSKKSMDERWSQVKIKLPNNVYVKVVELGEEWSKVYYSLNKSGYVYTKYLIKVLEDMEDEPIDEVVEIHPTYETQKTGG